MITIIKRCKSLLIYTFSFILLLVSTTIAQKANELIITEIMADPTPTKGLPEKEYIELYNRSEKSINLNQFILFYNTTSVRFPDVSIQPKEYLIVTHRNNIPDFQAYGKVIGLNNFALNNTGTTLIIKDIKNSALFSVSYNEKWYTKSKTQGFVLEMIDTDFSCVEEGNWASSEAILQGTPGKENSIKASQPDLTPPGLVRYELENASTIKLVFSEKLDSLSAVSSNAYTIDKSLTIDKIRIESPTNRYIYLSLNFQLQENTLYTLTARNIADCSGNVLKEAELTIADIQPADSGDVVINEILFNPRSGGEDFVEIYNRSNKFISLKDWALGNIDAKGTIANSKPISSTPFILKPKQFLVLTKSVEIIKNQYFKAITDNILEMVSLPTFPDESGTVILMNNTQKVFDRFDYDDNLHHTLIDDKSGVSLEKADYNLSSSVPSNWHSAAASEGYATPGYANSQGILSNQKNAFSIEPEIFTPDGDGFDDVTLLKFRLDIYGYIANAYVFDINGRMLKQLAQNQLLGSSDQISWDGKNASNEIVTVGYYVILVELFNPNGEKQEFKGKVVVGSKY
ncbi:lamin tail domain-containing protein [Emticicia sp. BO119]|uniref:lamin tail domain-containing protein n=1 Tax=Emticicia sp. BO119 TaxID=2757768 RepID=UPI0015F013E6|nr:lamin tail domain-containing protein [Emticicia sp. BO119]MBA4853098.1 lamin tail domain-containing protein [Emticicia sp. BO119]